MAHKKNEGKGRNMDLIPGSKKTLYLGRGRSSNVSVFVHSGLSRFFKSLPVLLVVVTSGAKGCWFTGAEAQATTLYQPAFPVEAVDTTGCGDVFHGAYASALARGLGIRERVRLAAAAAALKATRPGGQAGCPTLAEVEAFMKERTA